MFRPEKAAKQGRHSTPLAGRSTPLAGRCGRAVWQQCAPPHKSMTQTRWFAWDTLVAVGRFGSNVGPSSEKHDADGLAWHRCGFAGHGCPGVAQVTLPGSSAVLRSWRTGGQAQQTTAMAGRNPGSNNSGAQQRPSPDKAGHSGGAGRPWRELAVLGGLLRFAGHGRPAVGGLPCVGPWRHGRSGRGHLDLLEKLGKQDRFCWAGSPCRGPDHQAGSSPCFGGAPSRNRQADKHSTTVAAIRATLGTGPANDPGRAAMPRPWQIMGSDRWRGWPV